MIHCSILFNTAVQSGLIFSWNLFFNEWVEFKDCNCFIVFKLREMFHGSATILDVVKILDNFQGGDLTMVADSAVLPYIKKTCSSEVHWTTGLSATLDSHKIFKHLLVWNCNVDWHLNWHACSYQGPYFHLFNARFFGKKHDCRKQITNSRRLYLHISVYKSKVQ